MNMARRNLQGLLSQLLKRHGDQGPRLEGTRMSNEVSVMMMMVHRFNGSWGARGGTNGGLIKKGWSAVDETGGGRRGEIFYEMNPCI